jgi:hypothetical protein
MDRRQAVVNRKIRKALHAGPTKVGVPGRCWPAARRADAVYLSGLGAWERVGSW